MVEMPRRADTDVLRAICEYEPVSVGELAAILDTNRELLTIQLIRGLEPAGLVSMHKDPRDSILRVSLTEAGARALADAA
jgi:DNA-binding MarR family transcriptional regulator